MLKSEPTNARRYPLLLTGQRIVFGLLCGLLYDVRYRGFVVLAVQTVFFLFLAIRNPYQSRWMVARLLFN